MDKKGRIAPVDSNFAYEAATMDSLGTVDRDDRWQDNWLENIEKSEECETVVKDCASNVITNDAGMRSGHDCVTDAMESEECEFTRRGMCKRHGVKGTRIELKCKVWKKRKYDYGYVTTKKIVYTCNIGKQTDIHTDKLEGKIVVPQSKCASDLGSDNPQRGILDGISRSEDLCLKEKVT